jgi:hypothetical protein
MANVDESIRELNERVSKLDERVNKLDDRVSKLKNIWKSIPNGVKVPGLAVVFALGIESFLTPGRIRSFVSERVTLEVSNQLHSSSVRIAENTASDAAERAVASAARIEKLRTNAESAVAVVEKQAGGIGNFMNSVESRLKSGILFTKGSTTTQTDKAGGTVTSTVPFSTPPNHTLLGVLLQGWEFDFPGKVDHHIDKISLSISNEQHDPKTGKGSFKVIATYHDKDASKDPFNWRVWYTVASRP